MYIVLAQRQKKITKIKSKKLCHSASSITPITTQTGNNNTS